MIRSLLFIVILLVSGTCFSQVPDTELEEVLITGFKRNELGKIEVSNSRIESKLAPDIGTILVLFPGIQVRSYGDVGGLKTAGFRSLGANHTSIVIDQQEQPVTQSGSTDLSNIPTEFVRSVALIRQEPTNITLPIHSKLAGALIRINTLHHAVSNDTNSFSLGFQTGSFGYYSADLAAKLATKKWQFTLTGKGRTYEGSFPFTYLNYQTEISEDRFNNALRDGTTSASISFFPKSHHKITLKATLDGAQKELAGAVVFYNQTANQHLLTSNQNIFLAHITAKNRWKWNTNFTFQNSFLTYLDSNYLNAQGYLKQEYQTRYINGQSQYSICPTKHVNVVVGTEFSNETIIAGSLTVQPYRTTLNQFAGADFQLTEKQLLSVQLGAQNVLEDRDSLLKKNWYWLPAIQYGIDLPGNVRAGLTGRYTVRQPTFSELYYQQIGTADLKPEEAYLVSLPIIKKGKRNRLFASLQVEPFFSYAENKIIAIPTKNLFVWSIQNIGKSQSTGVEVFSETSLVLKRSKITQSISFTYQEAIDLSDSKSTVYRNQLTYVPKENGSYELSFLQKNWSVYTLFTYQGMRYALQENIPSNEVAAFYTVDIGGSYSFAIQGRSLKLTASCKNITNQYNQYIRYFVLPGVNFQLKLSYAL